MSLKMNADELMEFLIGVFPQVIDDFQIEDLQEDKITVRLKVADRHLRPGGTVSGPSMFSLADCAFYMMVLARIGREALTVTTNCSIDFMRKPEPCDLIGKARLHKLGRSLAVGDVLIYSDGAAKPVARASLTYAIPPKPAA